MSWYKKSAEQSYTRAQINLGYMYAKGMGVPKDMTLAMNFYRKASGLENDQLVLNSDMQKELAQTREKLNKDFASAQIQSDLMKKQLASLHAQLEKSKAVANMPAACAAPGCWQRRIGSYYQAVRESRSR